MLCVGKIDEGKLHMIEKVQLFLSQISVSSVMRGEIYCCHRFKLHSTLKMGLEGFVK